jgi:hypothetical protein
VIYSIPGQPSETTVNVTADGVVVSTNGTHRVVVDGEEVPPNGVFMN